MKKVGVITLSGHYNYGNKLQNYALCNYIKKMNYEPETIWINSVNDGNFFTSFLRHIKHNLLIKKDHRYKIFKKFNDENIPTSNIKINFFTDLRKINNKYNYFITGSDQVWNAEMTNNFDVYFLKHFDYEKNSSYAASFAVNEIEENLKDEYKKGLKSIKYISVREDRGKEIVEELIERKEVEILIDPTMLLSAEEWDKVSKKPTMLQTDKYILNYFLGELSSERKKEIERVAKENNCKIINILDKKSPFYDCGPSEFLYLEKNAFLICTDSFHSSVFAILYNRPFIIFDRKQKNITSMNSRLETLINKFKLKDRKFEGKITEKNINHNYSEAYKILEEERKKSEKFLKKALDINE